MPPLSLAASKWIQFDNVHRVVPASRMDDNNVLCCLCNLSHLSVEGGSADVMEGAHCLWKCMEAAISNHAQGESVAHSNAGVKTQC